MAFGLAGFVEGCPQIGNVDQESPDARFWASIRENLTIVTIARLNREVF
jgi:hypothetical protein